MVNGPLLQYSMGIVKLKSSVLEVTGGRGIICTGGAEQGTFL